MSETVAVYAVPHTPSFVAEVQINGERSQTAQFFSKIRSHLEDVKPDLIVTVNNDHFNTFFFDNWPTFAIGVGERTAGPNDQTPGRPRHRDRSGASYIALPGRGRLRPHLVRRSRARPRRARPIAFHDAGNDVADRSDLRQLHRPAAAIRPPLPRARPLDRQRHSDVE